MATHPRPFYLYPVLALLGGFLFLAVSCGKKGPLELPEDVRPAAISDLRAESLEGETVLSWTRPRRNADGSSFRDLAGFLIVRASGDDPTFRRAAFLDMKGQDIRDGRVTWTDPAARTGETYTYRVSSRNSLKAFSLPSNLATVMAAPLIDAPTNLRGEGGDGEALLSWEPVGAATGYLVFRSLREDGPFERVTEAIHGDLTFREEVSNTTRLYYQVRAVGAAGALGRVSRTVEIRPRRSTPPEPVEGLKASYAAGTVYLSWKAVSDTDRFGIYEVCRLSGTDLRCVQTSRPSFADHDLPETGALRYEVRVVDNSASPVEGEARDITVLVPGPP